MTSKPNRTFDIDRLSEALDSLKKCLECTICWRLMTTPMKTRCGHSFCQECIRKVLQQNPICPLCRNNLNKRSISKDDHLESCIQKFKNLLLVVQIDSHVDVLSHSKQPRNTRESCSNSNSSQSSVSNERKRTRKRSNQSTFEVDRPSTSRKTAIDCDNPPYNANSLIQPRYDQTLTTNARLLPDGNDNTLYSTPDVKVRTWIHSLIESESAVEDVEDKARSVREARMERDLDRYINSRDTRKRKRSRFSEARKSDSSKLKYNKIHSIARAKDHRRLTDAGKRDAEERVGGSRDDPPSATSSNQTRRADAFDRSTSHASDASTAGHKPSSADTTWSRVKEIGREMRKKTKKVTKLSVSTERSVRSRSADKCNESAEKNNENRNEKSAESTHSKTKSVPRIIEDILLTPNRKYESINKSATNDNTGCNKETNVSKQDAIDEKPGLSENDVKEKTDILTDETKARDREESFVSDKADSSMLQTDPCSNELSLVITLKEGEKLPIRKLNSHQMNEIIGYERDPKDLVDDANVLESEQHLVKEEEENKEDLEVMMELFDSPSSHRQRLIILTPEKLNESVGKHQASRNTNLRTPAGKLANPTSSLPTESQTPRASNDAEETTMTTSGAGTSRLPPLTLNKSRLSLKRVPRILESPPFSHASLMERMLISNPSDSKDVDSSVSNDDPSLDRLATVRRDLSSQMSGHGNRPSTDRPTTAADGAGVSAKSTVVAKNNKRDVGEAVCGQDRKLSVQSTSSRKPRKERCGFSVKFTQLGRLIKRRDVKYYYKGVTKREGRLPAKVRVASVYNMQRSSGNMLLRGGDKSHNFESLLTPSNNSQDVTGVTVLENVHYVHKSAASLDNTILETTRLTHSVPASSTPKADTDRRPGRAEATEARGSSSTRVTPKPSTAEEAPQGSPDAPRADQNATQQKTPRAHSHTINSVRLLSPDKDSQLQFLTVDSPMSQHGQSELASSARPARSELEVGSASTKDNNLVLPEVRDSQLTTQMLDPLSERLGQGKKRKRDNDNDDDNDDDDDSSISSVSMSSQRTIKLRQDKTSSHSNADKKFCSSSSCNRGDEVICLDHDDHEKAHERKFKRILSISDSDTDTECPAHVAQKSNRSKNDDRCDQGNASIMSSTPKRRKSLRGASDEDFRIRNIVDKWSNELDAAQKKPSVGTRGAKRDAVKPTRLTSKKTIHCCSSSSINSFEGEKRGGARLSEKSAESELFFESNSVFNSEGLEHLVVPHQSGDKSSRGRKESPSSMDLLADDIINKVLLINRSQQSNSGACRSTGVAPRTNGDGTSQKDKSERHECNLLQDNFDEIIANVELPQSEDVVPCSEPPAHRNPDRSLNRTLTEQNTSSCPAMTNESRDVARHGQMKPASSTADIFEYCSYSAGKGAKKTHPNSTLANSDKENILSHGQRKHDHAEEDRRDRKGAAARSPESTDKVAWEKTVSRNNNVSQEKRGPFDRAEMTERASRTEKEVNVPADSTSQANHHDGKVQGKATSDELNVKDLSSDSLMNITLHQARLRMLEEDLFGAASAKASKASSDDSIREEQRTPRKRKRAGAHRRNATSQGHSADEDDIVENTPETKMRNSGGKTIDSSARRNIATLNLSDLSPIPSFSEQPGSITSSRKRTTSKSEHANTPKEGVRLCEPLYQSTPKVSVSSSSTAGRRDDVFATGDARQPDKRRATTSGVAPPPPPSSSSSATKRTADGDKPRNTCRQADRGRLRFVCTGLTTIQIANVQAFARLHNAEYAGQFDPSVTHVIVNTIGAENAAKSTLKYLQGIAHCKWVVSYKWIEDCASKRQLLPESSYEATTQSADINGPGPRNSRLRRKGLFEDFTFLCIGPYDNVSLSQYQDLLRATGATVVNSLESLVLEKKGLRGIVVQGDTHETSTIESWYRDARAPPILIDWIVECIGHYRLLQLIPYIQTLSPQHYCAIGYPREIIGEEEEEEEDNSETSE